MNIPSRSAIGPILLAAAALQAAAALSWGQILFTDDFDGHAANTTPGAPWTRAINAEDAGSLIATPDDNDTFGQGTSNQFLLFRDNMDTLGMALQANDQVAAEVLTFSFGLYEPDRTQSDPVMNDYLDLWFYNGSIAGANNVGRVRFGRGEVNVPAVLAYGFDTLTHFDVVLNNSASSFSYGDRELASGTLDIWMNGNLEPSATGIAMAGERGTVNGFQLNTPTSARQEIYLDDFTVRDGAFVIPEPRATAALLGLCALVVGLARRRSRSTR